MPQQLSSFLCKLSREAWHPEPKFSLICDFFLNCLHVRNLIMVVLLLVCCGHYHFTFPLLFLFFLALFCLRKSQKSIKIWFKFFKQKKRAIIVLLSTNKTRKIKECADNFNNVSWSKSTAAVHELSLRTKTTVRGFSVK